MDARTPAPCLAGNIAGTVIEFRLDVAPEGDACVVRVTGELDIATRAQLFIAAKAGDHPTMVIDLAAVTFMDCAGYRGLVATRIVVERSGRVLAVRGAVGQPAQLLRTIAALRS